jgi:hypothetical protein
MRWELNDLAGRLLEVRKVMLRTTSGSLSYAV